MLELLHLCQRLSSFFKNFFWLSALFSFRLVWGFANSGKSLLRWSFSEIPVHGNCSFTGKPLPLFSFFFFLFYFLHRGCVLSGWGAKGFAFTLFSLFR
jgi:hypothetical protein